MEHSFAGQISSFFIDRLSASFPDASNEPYLTFVDQKTRAEWEWVQVLVHSLQAEQAEDTCELPACRLEIIGEQAPLMQRLMKDCGVYITQDANKKTIRTPAQFIEHQTAGLFMLRDSKDNLVFDLQRMNPYEISDMLLPAFFYEPPQAVVPSMDTYSDDQIVHLFTGRMSASFEHPYNKALLDKEKRPGMLFMWENLILTARSKEKPSGDIEGMKDLMHNTCIHITGTKNDWHKTPLSKPGYKKDPHAGPVIFDFFEINPRNAARLFV